MDRFLIKLSLIALLVIVISLAAFIILLLNGVIAV
jgi:hypothetical protein